MAAHCAADERVPEFVEPVRALAGALADAGWQAAERGDDWYAERFLWTRPEAPETLGEVGPSSWLHFLKWVRRS